MYTPFMNSLFGTSMRLDPAYLSIPMTFGLFLIVYSTLRRLFVRRFAPYLYSKPIDGMQMYETRWSLVRRFNNLIINFLCMYYLHLFRWMSMKVKRRVTMQ